MERPTDLEGPGITLWNSITKHYELEPYEYFMLADACRIRTEIDKLDALVEKNGRMVWSAQGQRVHPAVAEARQQRITLARFIKTLDLPAGAGGDDTPTKVTTITELGTIGPKSTDKKEDL